jgi:hypothetical protein
VVMYLYVRSTSQGSEWSCNCMLGVQSLTVPSQGSEWSCICMLGEQSVPVPSQESEWSCICMLEVQARRVGGHVFAC